MDEASSISRPTARIGWTLPLVLLALAATTAYAAQQSAPSPAADADTRTNIRQIDSDAQPLPAAAGRGGSVPADVDQLAGDSAPDAAQVPEGGDPVLPLVQVGKRDRATSGTQLSTDRPSAQGAAAVSTTGQSRPQAVVRLTGPDACDPGAPGAASPACARVIETRSGEYRSAAAPVLSPEQRLLIDQQQREMVGDPAALVRRLGRSGVDADALDAQGVASLVLPGNPAPTAPADPDDPTDGLSAETVQLIEAIVQNAQGSVPQ